MELRHNGVLYQFEYDFAPNSEDAPMAVTETSAGRALDGSVHITDIYRGERRTPVSAELLRLMQDAAAEDAIAHGCPTVGPHLLSLIQARRRRRQSQAVGSGRG